MGFLDSLSKTLSTGVDRARFEAEKFQRTSRISGEMGNLKSQIDTNMRQLGERAMELYDQGQLDAPEIASLAQIIQQLRDQHGEKEHELNEAQAETFEAWQARQPQPAPPADTDSATGADQGLPYTAPTVADNGNTPGMTPPLAGATGAEQAAGTSPYACSNCGYALPANAVFCPNCGTRVASA